MKKQDFIEIHKRLDSLQRLLNGGKGSGNFGHSGRPGKVGGSGKSSAVTLAGGRMEKGIREYNPEKDIDGGFTIDLKTGEAKRLGKSTGYAVGGYGTEMVIPMEDWNDKKKRRKLLREYHKENASRLDKEGYYLGGWVPTKNSTDDPNIVGKVVLDVSRVFQDKKQAAREAIKTNQDSITGFKEFDWFMTKDLAKEFGMEKAYKKTAGERQIERQNS